jgi:hypothetical protein
MPCGFLFKLWRGWVDSLTFTAGNFDDGAGIILVILLLTHCYRFNTAVCTGSQFP